MWMIFFLIGFGFEMGSGVCELIIVDMMGFWGRFLMVMWGGGFDLVWVEDCFWLDFGVGFVGELMLRGFGFGLGIGLGCRGGLVV